MATTITLTPEMERFVQQQITDGHYRNAETLIEEALRDMKQAHRTEEEKMQWLIAAIKEGDESGIYEGDPFADLRQRFNLPVRQILR